MKFVSLMRNEMMKINSKKTTLSFLIFLAVITLMMAIPIKIWGGTFVDSLNYLGFTTLVSKICDSFIIIYAIVLGCQVITEEYKDGTIKQLLIRPASRTSVLLSKYLSVLIMIFAAILFMTVFAILTGAVFFQTQSVSDSPELSAVLKMIIYTLPGTFFISTLAFFVAVAFKSTPLAISVAVVAHFLGSGITMLIAKKTWAKYVIYNNMDWSVYDKSINPDALPPFPGMTLDFSVSIWLAYMLGLLVAGFLIFNKRDIL
ncbi:ABC transporter permease [Paenibacillus larvae]|uniref:Putative membrane protein n=1 Tax=Paenibacillus larvae subsp. larvae TaxID=147375 RepID=A0A6C0QVT3_9BACL|nr:ABC transporter permease [Paenibacillus larvae]QHZ52621.1 putative membrane protein [Paenibacillus larvae subsp. larvae]